MVIYKHGICMLCDFARVVKRNVYVVRLGKSSQVVCVCCVTWQEQLSGMCMLCEVAREVKWYVYVV